MILPTQLDELIQRLIASIPSGARELPADLEKNFRAIVQGAFSKMDLLTREEFDAQVGVLRRTRAKLEQLTKDLDELKTAK